MKTYHIKSTKQTLIHLLFGFLILTLYSLIFSENAHASCWVGSGGAGSTSYGLTDQNIQDLGAGGCPNAFNGGGLQEGTWTISCDRPEELCNTYAVRSAVCGNNPEILPGCVGCEGDILYCYGNDYRRCDPTSGIFPAPTEFGGNTSDYLSSPPDGIVYFNGVQYFAPPAGIFYCDSNVFGCGSAACGGQPQGFMGGECPAEFGFIGGTYYNACAIGPLCDLDEQYYSPGDFIFGDNLTFAVGEFPKRAPHPHYEAFKHFICNQSSCDPVPATFYCERGAIQRCSNGVGIPDPDYCPIGPVGTPWCNCITGGNCQPTQPLLYPFYQCDPNGADGQDAGWTELGYFGFTESGSCQDMQTQMPVAFTPGYVLTLIPHLMEIWDDTVNRPNAIFTPFRTAKDIQLDALGQIESVDFRPVEEWPGESDFHYSFSGGWAMAGDPHEIDPPDQASVYFRYLGYLLCARENLIDKLSPFNANPSYQYYEPRCDNFIW